jgi:hypothetical protein
MDEKIQARLITKPFCGLEICKLRKSIWVSGKQPIRIEAKAMMLPELLSVALTMKSFDHK